MKNLLRIVVFLAALSCLVAVPIDLSSDTVHTRVRRQWGMPMGGFGGFPMGGFGMPFGGGPMGFGMPMMGGRRSRGHSMKFTSLQLPFISFMSGSMSGHSNSAWFGK